MAEEGSEYLCYARDNCIYVSDAFYDSFDYQNEDDAEYFDYLILKEQLIRILITLIIVIGLQKLLTRKLFGKDVIRF